MASLKNKFWVKKVKVVAIHGGGVGCLGERKKLNELLKVRLQRLNFTSTNCGHGRGHNWCHPIGCALHDAPHFRSGLSVCIANSHICTELPCCAVATHVQLP